jgi:predicted dehydrogenase
MLLEAGILVICDLELNHLAEVTNVFAAVTDTYSGNPMARDARQRIAAGEVGDGRFVYLNYLQEWLANDPSRLAKAGVVRRLANNRRGLRRRQRALDPE